MKAVALLLLVSLVSAYAQVDPTTITYRKTIAAGQSEVVQVPGAGVASGSLYYVHLQCAGATTQSDYTVLFNLGSAPSAGNSISGVNEVFWNGIASAGFSSEHVAPIATGNTDIYYSVTNKMASAVTCSIASFLTKDMPMTNNAQITFNVTSPVLHYFTINVPSANSLITVRMDDSDDDLATHLRVLMKQGGRPTFADPVSESCDQFFGREEEITECLFSAPDAGAYTFGIFTTSSGIVQLPDREVFISFGVSAAALEMKTSTKYSITIPPGGNAYYTYDIQDADTAMFLRVTTSQEVVVNPLIALDTFPTEESRLKEPQIVTEVDTADPANVLIVSIIQASVLQTATAHVRLYNAEFVAVTYTIEPVVASYARLLPGDDKIVSLPKGFNGLYRTVLDGTDNVLVITLVSDVQIALWIREDIPPTINTADADFIADIFQNADGKTVTRAIWSPSSGQSPEGTWYFRAIPFSNATSASFTISVTSGHVSDVGDHSEIGGRLVKNGIDYFRTAVSEANLYGLYVAVESKNAGTKSLFWNDGYPTENEHTDRVSSRFYQLTWESGSDHYLSEHYILPKDLTKANWTYSVYPATSGPAIAYSLISVLFEIFPITESNKVQTYPLSQYKMAVMSYTHQPGNQHTDDLSITISPADGLDVIASRDTIPFSFDKAANAITSVSGNTLTLTLPSATAGTYYFRVYAAAAEKEIQSSIRIGKAVPVPAPVAIAAPSGGQTAAPQSSNNESPTGGNNLLLILIVVFLGLLVVILTVVVVMFVLRSKNNASAEMSNIGGDAKYSLLNEENPRV